MKKNGIKLMNLLIKYGVDINEDTDIDEDNKGITSSIYACQIGNKVINEYLINNKVDINKRDKRNRGPLFYIFKNGNDIIIKYLLENGFYINENMGNGTEPLIFACYEEKEDLVKYLVENGALLDMKNK